ncbi:MAG: response regulator, partial [Anaerolineales bacterium]
MSLLPSVLTKITSYQPPPGKTTILIVDDHPVLRESMVITLKPEGYQLITAANGQEALDIIAKDIPDLVLLDVMMPGIDGLEVCKVIKNNPATMFLPVVLVTALNEVEHRVLGAEAGADDFLSKPFNGQELLTRVKSLVRVNYLHKSLEASNKKLSVMLKQRSQQLDRATNELKTLLKEKAHFTTDLTPYNTAEVRADQATPATPQQKEMIEFKKQLLDSLADSLEGRTDLDRSPEIVAMLSERLALIYNAAGLDLSTDTRQSLFRAVLDDILGYGPIEPLLADPSVSEVMVNSPMLVYAEKDGVLVKTSIRFDDEAHIMRIINRIIRPLGRRVDRNAPMVDARLPDGSRVNAIIAPCAIDSPSITIRKFSREKLTIDNLIGFGSITKDMAMFLRACVCSRLNIVVAGGTGSGKTTLLNVLSSFIPPEERIVTIEDSAELQLQQENVVRLETAAPDLDGSGEVTVRDLVRNALRMRPDRIVIGEVRGGEALDMLQAMNTGHDGSLTTVHANTARDTISRLETLVMMAG